MARTAIWSGTEFVVYDPATTAWNDVGGIYVFASITNENKWHALYVGQAESFKNRLPSHERWDEARRLGASHVHAVVVPQAASRDTLEQRLIQAYQPRLNVQLK